MTCRGADQIMLMYVARSMNLWASTDMRLTISPTVDDFLAELVITRAWRQRRGKEGECDRRQPSALPPGPRGGRRQLNSREATALFSSPGGLSAFPAHVSHHKVHSLIDSTHCLLILSSSVWKGPQRSPKPGLHTLECVRTPREFVIVGLE